MKNKISEGKRIEVAVADTVMSGDIVAIGDLVGIASTDAEDGTTVIDTEGVFTVPCSTTDDIAVGASVYVSATSGSVTVTATDNTLVGVAVSAAPSGSTEVNIKIV